MSDEANKLLKQASQAGRENRLADAKRDLVMAVDLCRKAAVPVDLAKALTSLGQIERDLHHPDAAQQHYQEAVAIYCVAGGALNLAHTIRHVGDIQQDEGRAELAEPCYHEALNLYRSHEQTPPLDLANAIRGLAILKDNAGEIDPAMALWQEARDLYTAVKVKAGVAESSRRLALLVRGQAEKQIHGLA